MKGKKEPDWVKNEENITEKIQAIEDSKNNFESECKLIFVCFTVTGFQTVVRQNRMWAPSQKNFKNLSSILSVAKIMSPYYSVSQTREQFGIENPAFNDSNSDQTRREVSSRLGEFNLKEEQSQL